VPRQPPTAIHSTNHSTGRLAWCDAGSRASVADKSARCQQLQSGAQEAGHRYFWQFRQFWNSVSSASAAWAATAVRCPARARGRQWRVAVGVSAPIHVRPAAPGAMSVKELS
jgi:hypothetical protein